MIKPFNFGYYNSNDLKNEGFKSIGHNVEISKNCMITGLNNIVIGNNVRIDDYCTIVARGEKEINIGSFIHIGSHCHLSGNSGIIMKDFSGLSQGVKIYSDSDDYGGKYLTNPTVPKKYTKSTSGTVILNCHVIIGAGSVVLPRVVIGDGVSIGALSLVTKSLKEWGVYFGCPVKRLRNRSRDLLNFEYHLLYGGKR